jgi:hypothetical protein
MHRQWRRAVRSRRIPRVPVSFRLRAVPHDQNGSLQMTLRLGTTTLATLLMLGLACSEGSPSGGGGTGGGSGGTGAGGSTTDAASTGGASGRGDSGTPIEAGGGRPTELPISDSLADLGAFVARRGYRSATWISETAEPREQNMPASQHGSTVRVWENAPLVASLKAGRDGRDDRPYPDQWSMAVKELYDPMSGDLVGVAASFKTTSGSDFGAWTYYCYGPDNRCSFQGPATIDMPLYGKGSSSPASNCGFCHGFSVFTVPP